MKYHPYIKNMFFTPLLSIATISLAKTAYADVLIPGNINDCGELAAPGTYTFTSNISSGGWGTECFLITSDDVIIEPNGFELTGGVTVFNNIWAGDDTNWTGSFGWTFKNYSINIGSVKNPVFRDWSINEPEGQLRGSVAFAEDSMNGGVITNDIATPVDFYNNSFNAGEITRDVNFYSNSYNLGAITGNVNFFNNSYNGGSVTGNAVFGDTSHFTTGGTVEGNAYLDTTYYTGSPITGDTIEIIGGLWEGSVGGSIYNSNDEIITDFIFRDYSSNHGVLNNIDSVLFDNNSFNSGTVNADTVLFQNNSTNLGPINATSSVTFNDTSYSEWQSITGDVVFNDDSHSDYNYIVGDVAFNGNSYDQYSTINGDVYINTTYYQIGLDSAYGGAFYFKDTDYSSTINGNIYGSDLGLVNQFIFLKGSNYGVINNDVVFYNYGTNNNIINGDVVFNQNSYQAAGTINGDVIFNDNSFAQGPSEINGDATFNDSSFNSMVILNNATFNDNSYNSGSVVGNATFNQTASNFGTIFGDGIFYDSTYNDATILNNATVYYPVSRPLSGSVGGVITYVGYPAMYFNDDAIGAAGDGDWDNPLNWWENSSSTIPAGRLPDQDDEVYVLSNVDTNTGSGAVGEQITFKGSSQNNISITGEEIKFEDSSINNGTTTGTTTFIGNLSNNLGYTDVSSLLIRLFTSPVVTTRNFLTEGNRNDWIIISQGVIVDITNAIYDVASNIFKALNGGSFETGSNPAVTPVITPTLPTVNQVVTKWIPSIDFGNAVTCEYSYDAWTTTNPIDCSDDGSDILRPDAGSNILYVRAINTYGSYVEKNIVFTYDNTVPTYTMCGDDLLDEATRPYYYLAEDVVGDCTITVDTELRGTTTGTTTGYTVTGNILARGKNLVLSLISVTGTVNTSGLIAGSNGGSITIATSTTGVVNSSGADNTADGGDAGDIAITNSIGITASSTLIFADGGDATSCGDGGDAGEVTLVNSLYGTISALGGSGDESGCPGSGRISGTTKTPTIQGTYTNPNQSNNGGNNVGQDTNTNNNGGSSIRNLIRAGIVNPLTLPEIPNFNLVPENNVGIVGTTFIPNPFKDLKPIGLLNLSLLPTNFLQNISKFVFSPIPKTIEDALRSAPQLYSYVSASGALYEQNIASLASKPILLSTPQTNEEVPEGLFLVYSGESQIDSYVTYDQSLKSLAQLVRVSPNQSLTIGLNPQGTSDAYITYLGQTIQLAGLQEIKSTHIQTSAQAGRYIISTKSSPIPLLLEVIEPVKSEDVKKRNIFIRIWEWLIT